MSKDNSNIEKYQKKRTALISLSKSIKPLVAEGVFDSVNEGLIETYMEDDPEIEEFNTFKQWKKQGYTIIKGSESFLVWGQPQKGKKQKEETAQTAQGSQEDEEYKFWPLCYLFANTQVRKAK